MDFRPASFKVHMVHISFHQLDTAAMFGSGVGCAAVANKLFKFESFSLIRHDDGYFIAGAAAEADVHFCFWIFLIAMHNRIVECFAERQLDIELFSRNTSRPFNQPHQAATSGEIARTSLGIQKSSSRMEERERFPENGN